MPRHKNEALEKKKTKDNNRPTARQHIRLSIHDFLQNMDVHYSTSSLRHINPNGNNQSCNEPKKNNGPTPTKKEVWRSYKIGHKQNAYVSRETAKHVNTFKQRDFER
ncbi:hypothetical protein HMPREF1991_01498 [Hoylesella loescheii DSM 19665 = JCM 12249 = ATCC 15930]|uniref:Uncharacterized protein n=1 Tax=Hoylesella loescheii DSM 19665 = JCM 12249 = ATCC 15930 TaxID=1122985 RepID=A0A069QRD7_HOYLO|nr:hypothetical protein HMPREF1991_01498 [Hoylesella loescheii DSM 19665 = JCM 12249 = ATCC 15930]